MELVGSGLKTTISRDLCPPHILGGNLKPLYDGIPKRVKFPSSTSIVYSNMRFGIVGTALEEYVRAAAGILSHIGVSQHSAP